LGQNKDLFNEIAKFGPKTHWLGKARWHADGNVWTTSGVSAGADGMLAFMQELVPKKTLDAVINTMEWIRADTVDDDPFAEIEGTSDILPKEVSGAIMV
jgi:transcriptional regulator GlxA family with amidase domain